MAVVEELTAVKLRKYAVICILALLIPVVIKDNYILHLLIVSIVWASVATHWNLTLGYGGMFHIAQPTFLTVGAYVAGMCSVNLGISPWLCLLLGGIGTALAGIFIGVPSLRVKGIYLILLTFAFHFTIAESVFHLRSITGGSMGLVVPTFKMGPVKFSSVDLRGFYYLALVFLIISLMVTRSIVNSNMGKALIATRDSEILATSCGINLYKCKLITFCLAALITGVVGAFYAHYMMVIGPELFSFSVIINGFGMIVIGGIGTFMGPVVGSFVITFLSELFRSIEDFRPIIVGVIIILMLIFAPKGIFNALEQVVGLVRGKLFSRD